jgi:tRNA threonylcarbamoyladenosine modification (KEOPS) complex  Pcc1 subunit
MKISTTLEFTSNDIPSIAENVAFSLKPDNLSNMETEIKEGKAVITIKTEKISSLIATVDDLLMNAKIAEDVICEIEDKE